MAGLSPTAFQPFLSVGNLRQYGDIQRAYLWKTLIGLPSFKGHEINLARESAWKGRETEPIESNAQSLKRKFPGKVTFDGQLQVTFEEYESRIISKMLYKQQQIQHDITKGYAPEQITDGNNKMGWAAGTIENWMLTYNGKIAGNIGQRFYGCWLESVAEVPMNSDSGGVLPQGTFSYDYWVLVDLEGNIIADPRSDDLSILLPGKADNADGWVAAASIGGLSGVQLADFPNSSNKAGL
jgi:hypothetical protein